MKKQNFRSHVLISGWNGVVSLFSGGEREAVEGSKVKHVVELEDKARRFHSAFAQHEWCGQMDCAAFPLNFPWLLSYSLVHCVIV